MTSIDNIAKAQPSGGPRKEILKLENPTDSAPLSDDQWKICEKIKILCRERPRPSHLKEGEYVTSTSAKGSSKQDSPKRNLEYSKIEEVVDESALATIHSFDVWHLSLEKLRLSEAEQKYKEYVCDLKEGLKKCKNVKELIGHTLNILDDILKCYKDATKRSELLHKTGERLLEERQQLFEFSKAIKSRLVYFEELETISTEFHQLASAIDTADVLSSHEELPRYIPLMTRLDSCISYISLHPQYAESAAYNSRYVLLRSRALASIRHKVMQVLKSTVSKLQSEISSKGKEEKIANDEGALMLLMDPEETYLLYIKFRSITEQHLKEIFKELGGKKQKEYENLYKDCQQAFLDCRLGLLSNIVKSYISVYNSQNTENLIRNGFSYILKVCKAEHELFTNFFISHGNIDDSRLMQRLGIILYDILRPRIISIQETERLCYIIEILYTEILENQISKMGEPFEMVANIVLQILGDAKERLTYLSQTFIQIEIGNFNPEPEDLDYPSILINSKDVVMEEKSQYSNILYPPLKIVLNTLHRLYSALDTKIFSGLAHQAILYCALSITKGGELISRSVSQIDGHLFIVRNLLILREQIALFNAEFSVVEKDLDFSHTKDQLRRILTGEVPFFSFSSNNVSQLMQWTTPKVTNTKIDSKKGIEKQLKENCEILIMTVTKIAVEPMLAFITKATAVRAAQLSNTDLGQPKPLSQHAFASLEKICDIVGSVNKALDTDLRKAVEKMKLYLPTASNFSTLYKPIKQNIIEAHTQINTLVVREYKAEEREKVAIKNANELNRVLEDLN